MIFRTEKSKLLHISILSILVAVLFGNTLNNQFVWDDFIFVDFSQAYRTFDLKAIFTSLANGLEYQPVRDLAYAFDYALWGRNPLGFHLSNILFFWMAVITVYLFSERVFALPAFNLKSQKLSDFKTTAFLAATLFAVHPLHSEVVSFVTCRNALVSGVFFFLSWHLFISWVEFERKWKGLFYAASFGCFALALFSKATTIVLPFLLLFTSCFMPKERRLGGLLGCLPFLVLSGGAYFLFKGIADKVHIIKPESASLSASYILSKLAVALQIPFFYIWKMFLPTSLSADYAIKFTQNWSSLELLLAVAGVVTLLAVSLILRKKHPVFAFCFGCYFIALIPVLNLLPTHPVVADRYAYLPTFTLFMLTAISLQRILPKILMVFVVSAIVISFGILTYMQNLTWKNEKSLWSHAVEVSPGSAKALTNLGRIYLIEEQRYNEAFDLFKRAKNIDSADPSYDLFTGCLFLLKNDPAHAIEPLQMALAKDDGNHEVLLNLGRAYEGVGDIERAKECFRRAISSGKPDSGDMKARAVAHLKRLGG